MGEGLTEFNNSDEAIRAICDWQKELKREKPTYFDEIAPVLDNLKLAVLEGGRSECAQAARLLQNRLVTMSLRPEVPLIEDAVSGTFYLIQHFSDRVAEIKPDEE